MRVTYYGNDARYLDSAYRQRMMLHTWGTKVAVIDGRDEQEGLQFSNAHGGIKSHIAGINEAHQEGRVTSKRISFASVKTGFLAPNSLWRSGDFTWRRTTSGRQFQMFVVTYTWNQCPSRPFCSCLPILREAGNPNMWMHLERG